MANRDHNHWCQTKEKEEEEEEKEEEEEEEEEIRVEEQLLVMVFHILLEVVAFPMEQVGNLSNSCQTTTNPTTASYLSLPSSISPYSLLLP